MDSGHAHPNKQTAKMNLDKMCNHRSKEAKRSKLDRADEIKSNGMLTGYRDSSKKSLSFFPDKDGSEDESEHLEVKSKQETRNNNEIEHRAHEINDVAPVPKSKPDVIEDNASTASSSSCEDHNSVKAHSDEDPHGDLDYDDDSVASGPASRKIATRDNEETPKSLKTSINDTANNTKASQVSSDSDNTGCNTKVAAETDGANNIEADADKPLPSQKPAKIQSFINFDTGRDSDHSELEAETKKPSRDRSRKGYENLLKSFFKDACFFQMKSINHENVQISKSMGVWQTPGQNETRLNVAFREHRNVILIFSVQQSGAFQGFARMASESRPPTRPVPWVLPARLSSAALGGVIPLEWLCTKELNFTETRDLYNPLNNNKPVKIARDGQQVDPKVARKLCSLFPRDSKKRLLACLENVGDGSRHNEQHNGIDYYSDGMSQIHQGPAVQRRRHQLGASWGPENMPNEHHLALADPSMASHHNRHQPGVYPRPPSDFIGPQTAASARSRLSGDTMWPGYSSSGRLQGYPYSSPYQRPPPYPHAYEHHHMRDLGLRLPLAPQPYPDAYQEDPYMGPYGPDYYHHPEFIAQYHPLAQHQQQSTRGYLDWHQQSQGRNGAQYGPNQRFHPYQRARR